MERMLLSKSSIARRTRELLGRLYTTPLPNRHRPDDLVLTRILILVIEMRDGSHSVG